MSTSADIALYGGAAGGGKTFALLLECMRHTNNSRFGAVVFRRTSPQIRNKGGLWDESIGLYPLVGAQPRESVLDWHFPTGATVKFAHLEHDKTVNEYQGAQIPLIAFDELTHFSERQFFYMLSRNRSTCGVRPYMRGTTNPDADSWVASFIAWWIDQTTGLPIPERAGVIRYFVRVNGIVVWGEAAAPLEAEHNLPAGTAKSFTFIPAKLTDNKALLAKDPTYLANLLAQAPVERARLLDGNWKVRAEAGKVFNRANFEILEVLPAGGIECRFWDFAATAKEIKVTAKKNDPDYTAGTKINRLGSLYIVTDCLAGQWGATDVEKTFLSTTRQDWASAKARRVRYLSRWEREPGSAGKREGARLVQLLSGVDAAEVLATGDKLTRARGLAAQAAAGNVKLLAGPWNDAFLQHMHAIPDGPHDDIMDSASGSFNELTAISKGFF